MGNDNIWRRVMFWLMVAGVVASTCAGVFAAGYYVAEFFK